MELKQIFTLDDGTYVSSVLSSLSGIETAYWAGRGITLMRFYPHLVELKRKEVEEQLCNSVSVLSSLSGIETDLYQCQCSNRICFILT